MTSTHEEILNIAQAQLLEWKPKLTPACYAALYAKCQHEWAKVPTLDWEDIFRGDDLTMFVCNWKPQ